MLIFSVSFQTLTEARKERDTKFPKCSGPFRCSRKYTRNERFRKIQTNKYRARNSSVVDQNWRDAQDTIVVVTTVSYVKRSLHQPDVGTRFREKQDQRETLQSRDIRQRHSKRRVEVKCQNRDSLKEDVCSSLACPKTFPRSVTIQEETRRCHSYFIRMISRRADIQAWSDCLSTSSKC